MAAAWGSGLPPIDRLVLVALADWADAGGRCWPSMPTIAGKTGVDVRTARRVMGRLEAAGHITTERRPGKGILYSIHPGQADPGHSDPGQRVPRTESALTPDTLSSNTSRTTKERKKATPSPSTREPFPIPDGVNLSKWNDFAEMRRAMARGAKGRPWTPSVARKAIEKLAALAAAGNDPGAVLDQSVLEGWQGLFPVKDTTNGRRGRPPLAPAVNTRGSRPDPALDMRRAALAELEAEERAAEDQAADRGSWLALSAHRGGGP